VPSKLSFSDILPNLPIQFSESVLANAKPQLLAEREVLFEAGDVADGCYRLEQGLLKVSIASPQGDERILTIVCIENPIRVDDVTESPNRLKIVPGKQTRAFIVRFVD
jgi:CRP-like cAMP-binding protein